MSEPLSYQILHSLKRIIRLNTVELWGGCCRCESAHLLAAIPGSIRSFRERRAPDFRCLFRAAYRLKRSEFSAAESCRIVSRSGGIAVDLTIEELSQDPRTAVLRVCRAHGGLYEDRPDPKTGYQQRCHDRKGQEKWDGYDINEWIRLCDCCLVVAMRSGSKWSPFFCNNCRPGIVAAERGIPIGRHSMMNRVDPFTFISMFDAFDRLEDWKSQRVRQLTETDEDPTLTQFLQTNTNPHTAVRDLLAWWDATGSADRNAGNE